MAILHPSSFPLPLFLTHASLKVLAHSDSTKASLKYITLQRGDKGFLDVQISVSSRSFYRAEK